jgi:DNA polymerase I-like protein with 3'-5' exonuclease and polymerase domains
MKYNIDLGGAENRIVAYVSGDERMISAFEDPHILANGGVHSLTASFIYDCDITEVSDEKGSSGVSANLSMRDIGKRCNHALNYMMGAIVFAETADITIKEAKRLRVLYLDKVYPMVKRSYWPWIEKSLNEEGGVTNLFGRKFRLMKRWGDELVKQGCSIVPQSSVAHIINVHGLYYMWKRGVEPGSSGLYEQVKPRMQVHDSIVFCIPDSVAWTEHAKIITDLKRSLEVPLKFEGRDFIIPVDVEAGYNQGKFNLDKKKGIVNPSGMQSLDTTKPLTPQLRKIARTKP